MNFIEVYHNKQLFSDSFLETKLQAFPEWQNDYSDKLELAREIYQTIYGKEQNLTEAQLEREFIEPVLKEVLGWEGIVPQAEVKIQGRRKVPDYILFGDRAGAEEFLKTQGGDFLSAMDSALVVAESKEWDKDLDRGHRDNSPHFQIVGYLSWLPVKYGFLINGSKWRIYVKGENFGGQTFFEVDFVKAIEDENSFKWFYLFFNRQSYERMPTTPSFIERVLQHNTDHITELENDLRKVIYEQWLENTGKAIYQALKETQNPIDSQTIYNTTLLLLFRILFIRYAEARNIFPANPEAPYYPYSLEKIIRDIRASGFIPTKRSYALYERLKTLFRIVDQGAEELNVPPYNGGLFSTKIAQDGFFTKEKELLDTIRIPDTDMKPLLDTLFLRHRNGIIEIIDYGALDTRRIGTIYEGLTEYTFRIADQNLDIVTFEDGTQAILPNSISKLVSGEKTGQISKGELYLVRHDGTRKATGTYYTPDVFVNYLVKQTIDKHLEDILRVAKEQEREIEKILKNPNIKSKAAYVESIESGIADLLMSIKILDPAMGSGHFLVVAAKYLTERLMALSTELKFSGIPHLIETLRKELEQNTGFDTKNVSDASLLLRLVVKRCIFGIDLNSLAVEIAKLSLWLDTTIPGAPLSFLSHHLRTGNSLVGYDLDEFINKVGSQNPSYNLFMNTFKDKLKRAAESIKKVREFKDITVDDVYQSAKEFMTLYREVEPIRFLLDLATASQYPGYQDLKPYDPTSEQFTDVDLITNIITYGVNHAPEELRKRVYEFREQIKPFHWKLEFPEAWKQQGFDIVIGNPPWDKVMAEDPMFFSRFDAKYRQYKKDQKTQLSNAILSVPAIKEEYDQWKEGISQFAQYLKQHYRFYADVGHPNLYRFFMERSFQMLREGGKFGFVVPGSFYQEDGSASLRKFLVENNTLTELLGFENRGIFFPEIHSQFKIALVIAQKGGITREIQTFFLSRDGADLEKPEKRMTYPTVLLKNLSSEKYAFLEFRSPMDVQIVQKCYAQFPPLKDPSHPWKIDFTQGDLNMTSDKHLFHEDGGDLPLYEGKMIWQFRHDWAKPRYWIRLDELKALKRRDGTPRFKLPDGSWRWEHYRVGFRDIASNTNIRTLIATIFPKSLCGNTVNIENFPFCTYEQKLFAIGYFNSFLADFIVRFMVQTHVNPTQMRRLVFPSLPETDSRFRRIAELSARLVGYTEAFADLMVSVGLDWEKDGVPPLCQKHHKKALQEGAMDHWLLTPQCKQCYQLQQQRIALQAEIDVIVAKDIFELTKEEYAHVLNSVKAGKDKPSPLRDYMEALKEAIRERWIYKKINKHGYFQ